MNLINESSFPSTSLTLAAFLERQGYSEKSPRMPALFIGHGSPMNAIEDNDFTRDWKRVAEIIPKPRAIVIQSAHWVTRGAFISTTKSPEMIYDMFGFPDELYQVKYPVDGDPIVAQAIIEGAEGEFVGDQVRGLDHGAWVPLVKMFPGADIPTFQISVDYSRSPIEEYRHLRQLSDLRDHGILFIGSGNIVHNLHMMRSGSTVYDWAMEFDATSAELIKKNEIGRLSEWEKLGSAAKLSIPSDDHFRPMLGTLALRSDDDQIDFFANGFIGGGAASMRSFILR